jgi:hypothetical protein
MTASTQVATLNRAQHYPVLKVLQQNSNCHMNQTKTETMPWQMRASGERMDFRWAKSGTTKLNGTSFPRCLPWAPKLHASEHAYAQTRSR